MTGPVAFPFRTLSTASVETDPWMFSLDGGRAEPLEGYLEDWDNASSIEVHRRIRIDFGAAAEELAIASEDLRLGLALQVGTGPGRMPRLLRTVQRRMVTPTEADFEIREIIPGAGLARQLELRTILHLAEAPATGGAMAPRLSGARLWADAHNLQLEGSAARFPVEIISFTERFHGQAATRALWRLHWVPGEPARDFHGAVRLQLNGDRKDFIERVNAEDPLTIQTMMADVISTLCERCLEDEEHDADLSDGDPNSVGGRVRAWLDMGWPGKTLSNIRAILENRPGEFRSTLAAVAEPGDET